MQATAAVARRPQILFGLLLRQPLSSVLKTMFIIESASPYRRIEDGIERFGLRLMANLKTSIRFLEARKPAAQHLRVSIN